MANGAGSPNGALRAAREEPGEEGRELAKPRDGAQAGPDKPAENAITRLFAEARLPGTPRSKVEDFLPDIEAITERRHSP